MKRKYQHVAITAAAVLVCGAAAAQERSNDGAQPLRSAWQDSLAYDEYLSGRELRASDLIGASVQNEQGQNLGEIEDLVVSREDDVVEAVIAVGGILGIGEKRIGIPYERLRVSSDGEMLFLAMTREQLEAQPEYDGDAERVSDTAPDRAQQSQQLLAQQAAQAGRAEQVEQDRVAEQTRQEESRVQQQADEQAQSAAQQLEQAERQAQQAGQQARQAGQQAQSAAQARAQSEQRTAEQARQQSEQRAAEQQAAAQARERAAQSERAGGREQAQPRVAPQAGEPEQRVVMGSAEHRATDLIGMAVLDSRGEEVGEIDDLVVSSADGRIEAVVAVGGVLGLGQRLVAVPLDELDMTAADGRAEGSDQPADAPERSVRVRMTSDELEAQPEFHYADERTASVGR